MVPNEVRISLDTSGRHIMNYHLIGETTAEDGVESHDFVLILTNPRDIIGAKWQSSIVDPHGEQEVTRPMDGAMNLVNNADFYNISAGIQDSLVPATFTRLS